MRSLPDPEPPRKTPRAPPYVVRMRDALRTVAPAVMPTAHRAVLLDLATYAAPDGGRCYPAIDTFRAELGMSRRKVYRILRELETARWIQRIRRTRLDIDGGGQTSNGYTLRTNGGPIVVARRTVRGVFKKPIPADVLSASGVADLAARRARIARNPTHT